MDSFLPQLDLCASSAVLLPAQAWLEINRQRSDPDGKWDVEHKWARHVWEGGTLASNEVGRWLEACGLEIRQA
jgi:hypothetical protein